MKMEKTKDEDEKTEHSLFSFIFESQRLQSEEIIVSFLRVGVSINLWINHQFLHNLYALRRLRWFWKRFNQLLFHQLSPRKCNQLSKQQWRKMSLKGFFMRCFDNLNGSLIFNAFSVQAIRLKKQQLSFASVNYELLKSTCFQRPCMSRRHKRLVHHVKKCIKACPLKGNKN